MSPRRVVLVDNDEAVLGLLQLDLGLEGHEIVGTATSGETGLRLCADRRPDVLVVDLRLGAGIDGVDVARQVQGDGMQVVVYTNYVTPDVVRDAKAAGAILVEKGNLSALRRAVAA
ncbi:MAG TPA: response regulator [Acidimicrobiales bacterium]|nr:response regulator [Acidimicrobiales bacterium]